MNPRFQLPRAAALRPFAIVGPAASELELGDDVRRVDALDARQAAFCAAMNRANCLAYDGSTTPGATATALGMPAWVMLDCCILPAAVFGFETPRENVPPAVLERLDPAGVLPWVGVSEYIALPSVADGTFIGVSLFSLATGCGLGTRTKARALLALGARRQVGVTQWASAGVKLHLRFGELRVVSPRVAIHNRPDETFVYELEVPDESALELMAAGRPPAWGRAGVVTHTVDPRVTDVAALVESSPGVVYVVGAGPVEDGRITRLDLAVRDV